MTTDRQRTTVASHPAANGLARLADRLARSGRAVPIIRKGGRVVEVTPNHIQVSGLAGVELGALMAVEAGAERHLAEVIAIRPDQATLKLFTASPRIGLGAVAWTRDELSLRPSPAWLGRVVNALGEPIDGAGGLVQGDTAYTLDRDPLPPLAMDRVRQPKATGVRAIDLFTPICAGQRIGIFAGSGVGKSTLLSMLARSSDFQTIVVALVAERAREVREFIEDVLQPSRAKAVTVVATSSESAMMRKLAAKTAMTIAEYLRDRGDDVLLVVDSLTRYAHALREVALAAGEPPVARGYAPSVFAEIPRLLERAGPGRPHNGSITGIFSVLVDGDDHNEPVADTVRGILDGHIVLDRSIADQGRFPALNVLASVSRLANAVWTKEEAELIRHVKALIARFEDTRELRTLGAYKPGSDLELDFAVKAVPGVYGMMNQLPGMDQPTDVFGALRAVLRECASARATTAGKDDA